MFADPFNKAARFGVLAFLSTLALAPGLSCTAQVQLPTVNLGETSFEDGLAGPGVLIENYSTSDVATELKDASGNSVAGSNRVTAISTATHLAGFSQRQFLGALIGGDLLIPMVDIHAKLVNGIDTTQRGFGDIAVSPLALEWAPKRIGKGLFMQRAMLNIGVPTGKYSNLRSVNIGNHAVSINPYYAFTYEPSGKLELSARMYYLWNSANKDPYIGLGIREMQAGQAFHMNYATSYEIHKHVRLGFNGYWLQQLTDHRINDRDVANSKERTLGIGPGIQIGGQGVWFRVNSYMETGVRNRMSGTTVVFRLSKVLGARLPKS
jgi:hypothetical protein